MLDKKLKSMLDAAATLTADDLDCLRGFASGATAGVIEEADVPVTVDDVEAGEEASADVYEGPPPADECADATAATVAPDHVPAGTARRRRRHRRRTASTSGLARGEYERQRTRESKVSTACIGRERERHEWWPLGTELVGTLASETFTAEVIKNRQVKSGRSLLITTGPAAGMVCLTPTRAAIEATEAHRQALNLGRGGGVTNGWEFWQPRA